MALPCFPGVVPRHLDEYNISLSAPITIWESQHYSQYSRYYSDNPMRCFLNSNQNLQCYWGNARYGTLYAIFDTESVVDWPVKAIHTDILPPSNNTAGASAFANRLWVNSLWRLPDDQVIAIMHNEFHGWQSNNPNDCPSGLKSRYWYPNAISAIAANGHDRFHLTHQLVITTAYEYVPDGGSSKVHQGIVHTSNIIKRGKYYYVWAQSSVGHDHRSGMCLYRTDHISDPGTWRGWQLGQGFVVKNINPYTTDIHNRAAHVCTPVPTLANQGIYSLNGWSYNTILHSYLAVGIIRQHQKYSIIVVKSNGNNLLQWGAPHLLQHIHWIDQWQRSKPNSGIFALAYCTMIDTSASLRSSKHSNVNFSFSGVSPWLVCTRFNPKQKGITMPSRNIVAWRMHIKT